MAICLVGWLISGGHNGHCVLPWSFTYHNLCRHDLVMLVPKAPSLIASSACSTLNNFFTFHIIYHIYCRTSACNEQMMALRNLFKNDLVLVSTNLAVVAGVATLLGNTAFRI